LISSSFLQHNLSLNLLQHWESADFTFVASKELAQQRRPLEITILAGPIIIASITMEREFWISRPDSDELG
jgi:hypothetical protein